MIRLFGANAECQLLFKKFREISRSVCIQMNPALPYNDTMEIFISEIPEEGLHRNGVLAATIFGLSPEDSIQPAGDITYNATIYHFDGVVTFEGSLTGKFQLQCNTCLEYLDYEANFSKWSSDLELDEDQQSFDLAEIIREDFLLDLPSYPRCDELVPGKLCPKAHYVVKIQKPLEEEAKSEGSDNAWGTLDQLKD